MPALSVGRLLALVVLVLCLVALALIVLDKGADVPAWLLIGALGLVAAARLDYA